jgi:hypothetical protein
MGLLWTRGRIAPWAALMHEAPEKMLTPKALRTYQAAAAPLDEENAYLFDIPVLRAHFDALLARLERIRPHEEAFRKGKAAHNAHL